MRRLSAFGLCLLLCVNAVPIQAEASSEAYCVMAEDGRVLMGENLHQTQSVASISKIMTAVVALEHGLLEEELEAGEEIELAVGSSIYLKQGEKMSLQDLLYGLMLRSGNDAAMVIACELAGDVETFVGWMNDQADELGMADSLFRNPSGLDEEDGGKEMAAIEYFNYCILYRGYNENDIINLPLVKDGERVSYTGWKNYLKELGRRDMKLSVQVFDRKGEYQRYISQFGLYESHWEIIRGINKTEGHVRTYFETNYKTARKVVEDLLIEEIIEKAYLVKIDKNADSDDMAHTLLEIKDKLVELTKKKREIADYDRQTELLHVLEARVAAFLELYEKQSDQCANLANVCVTGATLAKQSDEKLKALELAKDEKKKIIRARQKQQANLKIHRDKLEYRELLAEIERLQAEIAGHEQSVKDCQQELNRKESINDYLDYWKDKSLKEEHEAVIEASLHQNDDQLSLLKVLVKERRKRDEQILKTLSESEKQAEEDYQEAEGRLTSSENLTHEAEVAFAVAEHEEKQASERYAAAMENFRHCVRR